MLDDYSPLRLLDQKTLDQEFVHFPIRPAKLFILDHVFGGPKGSQGDSYFTASNPPFGAVFTYYLKKDTKTHQARRQTEEKKIKESGGDNLHPGWDVLKKESREESPQMLFTIRDSAGDIVRRITGPVSAGTHRITWNLRYGSFTGDSGNGPLVTPGTYTVQASRRADGETKELGDPQSFEVVSVLQPSLPRQDRQEVLALQKRMGQLQRQIVWRSSSA